MSDERDRHYEELLHEVARLRQIAANAQDSEAIERWERERAAWSAEYADSQLVHQARIEVAKETVARAYSAADFVRNAAASIVTLYTGVLGITSVLGQRARRAISSSRHIASYISFGRHNWLSGLRGAYTETETP
jgi:hypothetical protein